MRYQFRDNTYQGKTVRFIKACNVDGDGLDIAPVDDLHLISTKLREQNFDLAVITMSGHSVNSSFRYRRLFGYVLAR